MNNNNILYYKLYNNISTAKHLNFKVTYSVTSGDDKDSKHRDRSYY